MPAYYNEIEPFMVEWLKNLSGAGHVAAGLVDARSIHDVQPADLAGYTQCHFFAGLGAWSYALRLAGWPDDLSVWTGSCPCQPFSSAGGKKGFADERHLWPEWFRLIAECRPAIVFGEQVASPDGLAWFDAVSADLEGAGYAVGAADLCAAGLGAPHLRQRLWFVAYDHQDRRAVECAARVHAGWQSRHDAARCGADGALALGLGDAGCDGDREHARELQGHEGQREVGPAHGDHAPLAASAAGAPRKLAHADDAGSRSADALGARGDHGDAHDRRADAVDDAAAQESGVDGGAWEPCAWLRCSDGKSRPVEPGTFPLAPRTAEDLGRSKSSLGGLARSNRTGRLRGYGNAIVPQVAEIFIRASVGALVERL